MARTKKQPRILVIDIETAPLMAHIWSIWQHGVGLNMLNLDWSILSFSCKWVGDPRIHYHDTFRQRDKRDDSQLVKKLHKLLDEADIVVAHNGKKFDIRKIQARFVMAGMLPPSPFKVVDTLLESRKNFAMTSHKLEYLTEKLCATKKLTHKQFPGFLLWDEYLKGNPAAQKEMRVYNEVDVISLEELYFILLPWMTGHPNIGVYLPISDTPTCDKCGHMELIRKGTRTTQVGVYARYQCKKCGGWSRGRQMINSRGHRHNLTVS